MNKTILIGRLVRDPELRYTQSGIAVANFNLAVNRRFAKEGEQQADYIQCVVWNKVAENVAEVPPRVKLHRELVDQLHSIYAAKNKDYGNSYAKVRARYPDFPVVLIRLFDKLSRLEELLLTGDVAGVAESVEDTFLDLANYAIMEVVERRLGDE